MRLLLILLLFSLPALAEPVDRTMIIDGELIYAHIDYPTNPCHSNGERGGCHAVIDASQHIWYASSVAIGLDHELAHVKGMRHTEWVYGPRGAAAIVTVAGPGYPLGSTIFDNGYREFVFK